MSSNLELKKTCQFCGEEFIARTTTTQYCSLQCSQRAYKNQYEVKDVMSRITDLIGVEAKYKEAAKALTDAQTVIAGKDATIQNMQKDLDSVNARVGEYEKKEKDEL